VHRSNASTSAAVAQSRAIHFTDVEVFRDAQNPDGRLSKPRATDFARPLFLNIETHADDCAAQKLLYSMNKLIYVQTFSKMHFY